MEEGNHIQHHSQPALLQKAHAFKPLNMLLRYFLMNKAEEDEWLRKGGSSSLIV